MTNLGDLPISICPIEEQKEIVRQVDKLFSFADKLEMHYQKAKDKLDKLPQSVLAKTFRGELVPTEAELARQQGRDYETAEQLLELIKTEKTRLEQETKKNKSSYNLGKKKKT
jgi:type I restriction enzyme S subunit